MNTLNQSPKPTIAMIQGCAFGGGAGLAAACDIAIAATSARFCFSEVKLGLIPAVISPYVIKAIGERAANHLFMTAETFNAEKALALNYAEQLAKQAPQAVSDCKLLVAQVAGRALSDELMQQTAALIAKKRASPEGQRGLQAFLNKETPHWS
jgi:methylglutaconyl-CoA hydratase